MPINGICGGKFRHYLLGNKFTIYVDHEALKYLLNKAELSGRVIPWMLLFQEFNFQIVTRPGRAHVLADHLSQLLTSDKEEGVEDDLPDASLFTVETQVPWYADIAIFS